MSYGRIVLSAILVMFLMLFVAIDLVLFGVIPLNSVVVTVLPVVGLVVGALLGVMARKKQSGQSAPPASPAAV